MSVRPPSVALVLTAFSPGTCTNSPSNTYVSSAPADAELFPSESAPPLALSPPPAPADTRHTVAPLGESADTPVMRDLGSTDSTPVEGAAAHAGASTGCTVTEGRYSSSRDAPGSSAALTERHRRAVWGVNDTGFPHSPDDDAPCTTPSTDTAAPTPSTSSRFSPSTVTDAVPSAVHTRRGRGGTRYVGRGVVNATNSLLAHASGAVLLTCTRSIRNADPP